jgi:Family of unknown function (DUF6118)
MPADREEGADADGAERAFEALRAEVAAMRQAVEFLGKNQPGDTTVTLGEIVKALQVVGEHLQKIEQHPAISMTPAQYQRALVVAGGDTIRDSVRSLDTAARAAENERRELAGLIGSVRGQRKQGEWLAWTGGAALLLGLLISPAIARVLPFGLDGRIAAFIMQADRWDAGNALMKAQDPQAWNVLMAAGKLTVDNSTALGVCREAAAKTKKEQHCTLVVPAP